MSNLEQLADEALRDPLAAARTHAQGGGRVIGFVGAEIPVELIIAAKAFPLRLPAFAHSSDGAASGGGAASGRGGAADAYLESSFMPEVRSICEQYLQGAFDFAHSIIFPRSNDSAQRLYYYLSELRRQGIARGPEPLIFDLAKIPRDTSRQHSRSAVQSLALQIGARAEALPQAIAQRNRRRELNAAAAAARFNGASGGRGSIMDRLFRAADFCDADVFDSQRFALDWLKAGEPRWAAARANGQPRLLLAGSAPPDERLHLAVEAAGGNVVAELGDHPSRNVAEPMIPVNASFAEVADHYQESVLGPRAFVNRATEMSSHAKRGGIVGVINWLLEEEDALTWDLPAQTSALAAAGIRYPAIEPPRLVSKRRRRRRNRPVHPRSRKIAMSMLAGHKVVVLQSRLDGALARFLGSLGATLVRADTFDLAQQIADASFLIDDLGYARLQDLGWPRSRIEQSAPRVIHVSVTAFGSDTPRARWLGNELIASAMSGVLRLTGTPDRAPVKEALDACGFHADMVAAAGALAAHVERHVSGVGQHVDISIQEVAFSRQFNSVLVWQFDRRKLARVGGALNYGLATVRCIWGLADGWCFHTLMTGRFGAPANQALSDWMDQCGADNPMRGVDWLTYNRSTLEPIIRATWESAIAAFFRTRSKQDIVAEGRKRGINATVIADTQDVLDDPHLLAREFWSESKSRAGAGECVRVPRRFVGVQSGTAGRCGNCQGADAPRSLGPSVGRARSGFLLGAGGIRHHQNPGRSRRRCHQSREPHAALFDPARCSGERIQGGRLRR